MKKESGDITMAADDLELIKQKKAMELQARAKYLQEYGNEVKDVTDQEFLDLINNSPFPVFIDFWAPWCGPCRAVAPIIKKLAASEKYKGKMLFIKLNTDNYPQIAAMNGIRGIPTFMIFYKGKLLKRAVGAMPEPKFVQMIEEALKRLEKE